MGLLVSLLVTAAWPDRAFADASPSESESEGESARLFREGRALMLEGRYDEACPKIAESQRIDPHVGTLLNLAACHERQEKFASAWVEYQKALTAARAEGQADRAHLAEERLAVVEPKVPWLTLHASSPVPEDAAITLDDGAISRFALDKEMPVDAGAHVLRVTGPGREPVEERFSLTSGERRTVSFAPTPKATPERPDGEGPERLVVDAGPPEKPTHAASSAKSTAGWVIEPGAFLGYAGIVDSHALSNVLTDDPSASNGAQSSYRPHADTPVLAVNVFAGYRTEGRVHLGARGVLGVPTSGGLIAAVGPSISMQASSALRVGAWALVGSAEQSAGALDVSAGGIGAGLELGLRVASLQSADIYVQTTPFVVAGNGTAVVLPLGLSCLFR